MVEYFVFLSISAATSFSPGPAVFLSIRNGATYGLGKAFYGVLGNTSGIILLATASALGLSAVILASSTAFLAIKILGGCYLIYLGIKIWLSKGSFEPIPLVSNGKPTKERGKLSIYKEGFLVCITNPKAIVFFTALFPQFIDPSKSFTGQFLTLLTGFLIQSVLCMTSYAALSSKLHLKLGSTNLAQWINKFTGAVFIVFGAAIMKFNR
tara:strand:- start:149 stop:778 length:630 start_codon:yes stop_codon:yes gene_type:complete